MRSTILSAAILSVACSSAFGATIYGIGQLPGQVSGRAWSEANYISSSGWVTGFSWEVIPGTSSGRRAVAWHDGTMVRLPDIPGLLESDQTYAMSASDSVFSIYKTDSSGGQNRQWWTWDGTSLERFAPPGTPGGSIRRVSQTGVVFGDATVVTDGVSKGRRAWAMQNGVYSNLGTAGTYADGSGFASVYAVSPNGIAVGETEYVVNDWGMGYRAFRWQGGGTMILKPLATEPEESESWAETVNRNGVAAGYSWDGDGYIAVKWDSGTDTPVILGSFGEGPSGPASLAEHINDRGEIIGVSKKYVGGVSQGLRGFVWRDGTMTELPAWGGLSSSGTSETGVVAINENGDVIGCTYKMVDGVSHGYRSLYHDAAGNTFYIESPESSSGGGWNFPRFIAEDGTVFGEYSLYENGVWIGDRAYYWSPDEKVLTDLGALVDGGLAANGWSYLKTVTGMNEAGQIIGLGVRPNGDQEGYVLSIPEPASLGLVLLASTAMLRRKRSSARSTAAL